MVVLHESEIFEAAEAASPVDAVEAVTARLAAALDAERVSFLIADLSGRSLVRLGRGHGRSPSIRARDSESAEQVPFAEAGVAAALRDQQPQVLPSEGHWKLLAPVTQRGEVIGLLELVLPAEPDTNAVGMVRAAAHALAFVVIVNRRHTDLFEWGQRSVPYELSAEIQRRLLPAAFTCETSAFTLSAWLEPAATIGGDTFDYTLDRDQLHLSVTDAMGHGVQSALTATVCVSALRNARRAGTGLAQQAIEADEAVRRHASKSFVAGILGRLNLTTGLLQLLDAGHVLPLLVRGATVDEVRLPADRPFGLNDADPRYRITDVQLEPGDRLVIVTDGMLERRASSVDLADLLQLTRHEHARETVRHLADAVLEAAGPHLADDATTFILDWHGGHDMARISHAGATDLG